MARGAKKAKTTERDDLLELVRQQFLDAEEASIEERAEARVARQYYDGEQITDEIRKALKRRKQPEVVDNKIKDKIEYMLGMERKTRTDPKAFPRNPGSDEQQADAATDGLRYVCDDNRFPYKRSAYSEELFIEGRGTVEIIVRRKKGKKYGSAETTTIPKIEINAIKYDRSYVDPRSRETDYSDAKYKGIVAWMDEDEALAEWPDKKAEIEASFDENFLSTDTYEDRPHFFLEGKGRKRIQVIQHYFVQGGEWKHCKFVAGGFLEDVAPSAYMDYDEEEVCCCIEMQALYRDKDGNAYGMVRRYRDLQDEWNARRSKALHLLNTKQIIAEKGALGADAKTVAKNREEFQKPDGYVEVVPGLEYEVLNGLELSQGHLNMMLLSGQALQATGPNAALAGLSGDISGRAKQFDQQGGLVAIDYPFDAIRSLTLRVYRHVWNRIKQFWSDETWIRVRDEEQIKFVALNRKVTRGEMLAAEVGQLQAPDEEKQALLQAIAADPSNQLPVTLNSVAEIDVDITIDEVPDVMNLQQEQFSMLVELVKSGAVQIPPRALIEASQLRNKRKIMDAIDGAKDPIAQRMAQLEATAKELQNMLLEAKAAKEMAGAENLKATRDESEVDRVIKQATFIDSQAAPKTSVGVN